MALDLYQQALILNSDVKKCFWKSYSQKPQAEMLSLASSSLLLHHCGNISPLIHLVVEEPVQSQHHGKLRLINMAAKESLTLLCLLVENPPVGHDIE